MTVVQDYFIHTKKWKGMYGEKTIVLMQVGSFFEVYALRGENNTYLGSDIVEFSKINDMAIANKKSKTKDDNGIIRDVLMAGFGLPQLDKYINKLQTHGYTIAVYTQDDPVKNAKRSLSCIVSPGTHFSEDSAKLSNNIMCIWIEHTSANKIHREQVTVGIATLDILTGHVSTTQFNKDYYHNPCTYDELERIVSLYNPSESIIITNLSNDILQEIVAFTNLQSMKIHKVCIGDDSAGVASHDDAFGFCEIAKRAEKQTYQIATMEIFYPNIPEEEIVDNFPSHWVALQSLTFLLNFVHQHNPNLVNKLQPPVFENHSDKLILANHSLKQLNMLPENSQGGKLRSVSTFLNSCVTVMGKREFNRLLYNPTTNPAWLQEAYDITDYAIENELWSNYRAQLSGVNDIEKFSRKLAMKRVLPKELAGFYSDISRISSLYDDVVKKSPIIEYLHKQNGPDNIQNACRAICSQIHDTFHIDKCGQLCNLSNDAIGSLTSTDDFFIKTGVSAEIDKIVDDCLNSRKKLECIREWLSHQVESIEKQGKSTSNAKAKAKAKAKETADFMQGLLSTETAAVKKKTSFIKIHDTPKSAPIMMGTSRRIKLLETAIEKYQKINGATVELTYVNCYGAETQILFPCDDLDYFNIGSNKTDKGVTNAMIRQLSNISQASENRLVSEITIFYNRFIEEFMSHNAALRNIIEFATKVDVLQSRCYIADKYDYSKPIIVTADKAFFSIDSIRHPLIENLQTNELYVTNDINLGGGKETHDGMLLYGTNAVGKTSLIKAVGISIIMAQAGLYVPCAHMEFSPYRSIYTRILGNDNIFKGLSTFAVEMSELRTILRLADKDSIILGDELCSGTESDSALSIFTAGLEKLHETRCTHLFATHFHEIQKYDEIKALDRLCMKHMAVTYDAEHDALIYDRKLREGSGDSMYGLEVCKSLHLPDDFLLRAHSLRTKYNAAQKNVLDHMPSHFNAKKIMGNCEKCGEKGTEVHHLQHQNMANKRNYIESFHKNHKANLMTLCEDCHHSFHESGEQHVRVKTTKGFVISSLREKS